MISEKTFSNEEVFGFQTVQISTSYIFVLIYMLSSFLEAQATFLRAG